MGATSRGRVRQQQQQQLPNFFTIKAARCTHLTAIMLTSLLLLLLLLLSLALAPATAQITCTVTRRIGCFSDYIQSKRCYPAGPFDVKSQVTTARIASSPSLCWQSLTPTGRMSAPRTAPSCRTSTRP